MGTLLRAEGLVKGYDVPAAGGWWGRGRTRALDGVDLELRAGETLAVVGESGSGKSTLGRALLWLDPPDEGEVAFDGVPLRGARGRALRAMRRDMQMVFQDPYASLDPRRKAGDIVTENLAVHTGLRGSARAAEAGRLLESVGLDPAAASRPPHAFSGGQRQRLAIARAVATRPRLLVADEPVSALDLELQKDILGLLESLRAAAGMALVLITHDLRLVRSSCARVLVLKDGRAVETGPTGRVFADPRHAHTRELLEAVLPLPIARPPAAARP